VILALTSLYLPSASKIGVGYQVHGLANALVRRGHAVTVFSPCPRPEDAAYAVHVVPPGKRLRTFGFAWDLRKIDFSRFDVLNAHGDDWFLWGVRRPRHVHTFHGSCLAEMLNIRGLKEKMRMGLLAACETQAAWLADKTVAVSENTRRYIPGIRHVIPCGVDTERFSPALDGSRHPTPAVLFVGTMHGRKRGRMLLQQFVERVAPAVPGVELWCVCDRPGDSVDHPQVRWFGRVPEATLTDLFRRAWVFCLPSTYEGFGVPYIEAMASGLPVVATANPGSLEVTQHGRCGVIALDEHLGETIASLLQDEPRRQELSQRGLARSRDFSWDTVCAAYERLYAAAPSTAAA
jgi:glycosyltransferase involved in cell wall biosynthesis